MIHLVFTGTDLTMNVGVTLRIIENETYHELRDAISHEWTSLLERMGFFTVLIPNSLENPVKYFAAQRCDALILANGEDVKLKARGINHFYGTKRDITEAKLLSYAIKNKIPVLGVCRGMQFINVFFGGKLTDNLEGHVIDSHQLDIIDKRFQDLLSIKKVTTNSYHKHGILMEDIAKDLIPWAVKDNVIEGLYHNKYPIVAIQWHPERENEAANIDMKLLNMALK